MRPSRLSHDSETRNRSIFSLQAESQERLQRDQREGMVRKSWDDNICTCLCVLIIYIYIYINLCISIVTDIYILTYIYIYINIY